MNKIIIMGNLGNDPTYKDFGNGTMCSNFNVAVSENTKDKNGDPVKITEWFRCVAWGKTAEFINKHAKKGAKVFVDGKFKTRLYKDNNGDEQKVGEIVIDKFELLTWQNG
jgi:single-strand DNA-binding protein